MKPVVTDTDDFECQDKSKVTAYFGISELSRIWYKGKLNLFVIRILPTKLKLSLENKIENTKTVVMENEEFQHGDKTFQKAIFGISNCQYSDERNKIDKKSIKTVFTTRKLLIETLIEEVQLEALGEIWGWVSIKRKINNNGFFLENWRQHDSDATNKINGFPLITPPHVPCYRLRLWQRNWNL